MPVNIDIGDKVLLLSGDEKGSWGVVRLILHGEFHVSPANGTDVRVYGRDEIRKPRTWKEPKKTGSSKSATAAVFRHLWTEIRHMHAAWESMPYSSLPDFKRSAQAWLSDATELRSRTIRSADWEEVYLYFKDLHESN
jgi:hypothetical protein